MEEGDGPEPGTPVCAGARAAQGGADRAQEDLEDGAGEVRVALKEGAEPLGQGQHPLAHREMRQDVVGHVGGDLCHATAVAGGADAAALAGERDQALMAAVLTACSSKTMGQDAATG